jgi:N-acyl-D-amino-acid deacylase
VFDILIRNAKVVDGTGSPWYRVDVGVIGDTIAQIGDLSEADGHLVIDANDKVLCPGFIEIHGHSDRTLLINPLAESSIHLGVTTETIGNCGMSITPITQLNREQQEHSFKRIDPNFKVEWQSTSELFDVYKTTGCSVNIVPFVGHNTIRTACMGFQMTPARGEVLEAMQGLLREAMEAGAHGMSTGLEYPPGSAAPTEEIIELVQVVSEYEGIYPTHIRNRDVNYLKAIDEAIEIARKTNVPTEIAHNVAKIGADEDVMVRVFEKIEQARAQGLDITFDVGPYLGGQTTPTASLPPWAFEGGVEQVVKRLSDPETRQKIKEWEHPIWLIIKFGMWDKVQLATSEANPELIGKTFEEIAQSRGVEPYDVLLDLLLEEGEGMFDLFWEGEIYLPEDRDRAIAHPLSMICCDGRALAPYGPLKKLAYHHVYTWIPYLFRYIVKERDLLTLEEAVKKVTSMSAQRLGLLDRGIVRPGMKADLVIFDPNTVRERATLTSPHLYPEGFEWTIVNGTVTLRNGEHTGSKAGKLLTR